jgi:predicted phosphodiesterase
MRTLIYSDVHGNLPAFEKMLKTVGPCEAYISLGDLVNYAPWSNECVDLALSLPNSTLIMGNHEEAFLSQTYPCQIDLVKQFFELTFPSFDRAKEIGSFIEKCTLGAYICCHTIQNQYIYPDTNVVLDNNYIIGHSHHQFQYNNAKLTLYNAGSVGQNRCYINRVNYLIYDAETQKISLESTEYNFDLLINEMKARQYPTVCLDYYLNKKRG